MSLEENFPPKNKNDGVFVATSILFFTAEKLICNFDRLSKLSDSFTTLKDSFIRNILHCAKK